jgi:hypothetical protein
MSAIERADPKAGPFCNLSQAYFSGLDTIAKGYEPAFKGAGRWNLELMGLMTRRAQAWLDIPARFSQCRTPQDLVLEQTRFWQAAARDYTEGARRLTVALGAAALPGFNGARGDGTAAPVRDYITFPEPKSAAAAEEPKRDRRAA